MALLCARGLGCLGFRVRVFVVVGGFGFGCF